MSGENHISRRELGKRFGAVAAASARTGIVIPAVHASENSTIQIALIGCGTAALDRPLLALLHAVP